MKLNYWNKKRANLAKKESNYSIQSVMVTSSSLVQPLRTKIMALKATSSKKDLQLCLIQDLKNCQLK